MPSRAHACCLPDLTCDHMGEQQCYRRGGRWEPGFHIDCFPGICEDPDGHPGDVDITFSITNAETLGALQFDVDYSAVPGGFNGAAGAADCTRLAGDFAAFNDHEGEGRLSVALISLGGITGPVDIVSCRFCCPPLPEPNEFVITITDQSRPDLTPASATVAVTDVRALDTTSTTTTTTLSN